MLTWCPSSIYFPKIHRKLIYLRPLCLCASKRVQKFWWGTKVSTLAHKELLNSLGKQHQNEDLQYTVASNYWEKTIFKVLQFLALPRPSQVWQIMRYLSYSQLSTSTDGQTRKLKRTICMCFTFSARSRTNFPRWSQIFRHRTRDSAGITPWACKYHLSPHLK